MGGLLFWVGVIVYMCSVIFLIYHAWTNDQILFAIGIFFLNIILGPIYAILHWDECKYALFGMIIGFILRMGAFAFGAA